MEEKSVYDSEMEFQETAKFVWERYLASLPPNELPGTDMKFIGTVKVDGGFIVCEATFNPSK